MEREHKCQNEKDVTIHFERRFSRSTLLSGFGARTWTILSLRKERRKFSIIYNKWGRSETLPSFLLLVTSSFTARAHMETGQLLLKKLSTTFLVIGHVQQLYFFVLYERSHSVQEHKCISINGRCHDLSMYISTSSRFDVILISAHTTDHRKHQKKKKKKKNYTNFFVKLQNFRGLDRFFFHGEWCFPTVCLLWWQLSIAETVIFVSKKQGTASCSFYKL